MSTEHFALPDVGEGLTEADILAWHVAVGDQVEINQILVEVETAKAAVELPSPFAGTVAALLTAEGDTVAVGADIIAVETSGSEPPQSEPAPAASEASGSVLVGYGTQAAPTRRRARRQPATPSSTTHVSERLAAPMTPVPATPPVRLLAKRMGVDLREVVATGPRVTREDVRRHAAEPSAASTPELAVEATSRPAVALDVDEHRIPVKGVRKATAAAMVGSAFTAPHVTEFLTVDVTETTALLAELREHPAFEGLRVTPLLLMARALLVAVRAHPEINASWDEAAQEIVVKHRVNLGIAAATPRGLIVPNIPDAGALRLPELARALSDLTTTARAGRTSPDQMAGGTITITNVGVFGVDSATPILNSGEAAILCVGAVRRRPWEHDGQIALREIVQLSLSFDHRLVDGELGSKVLARIGAVLTDPRRELLLG